MNEADEEHHVAKLLIAELESMDGFESHYDAKFTVLAENCSPPHQGRRKRDAAQGTGAEARLRVAAKMTRRKQRVLADGVPPVGEEKMVKAGRGKGDSPAQAAKRKTPKVAKRTKRRG